MTGVEELRLSFLSFAKDRAYRVADAAPLLTDDTSLLFVNSTMTPFKTTMLQGGHIPPTAIVQPCFRERRIPGGLRLFQMFGLVGMADCFERALEDVIEFLLSNLQLERRDLHFVVPRSEQRLHDAVAGWGVVHELDANCSKYDVDWSFGCGEQLVGRGLTLAWQDPSRPPCSDRCDLWCECTQVLPLGNAILVKARSGQVYVDVGFGLEFAAAAHRGGDLFTLSHLEAAVARLRDRGYPLPAGRELVDACRAIRALVEAGCRPGSRRGPHVLRSLIREVAEIVLSTNSCVPLGDEVVAVLTATVGTEDASTTAAVVVGECRWYLETLEQGLRRGRAKAQQGRLSEQDLRRYLRETLGLPERLIQPML